MHGGPPRPRRVEEPVRQQAVAYGYAVALWCFGLGALVVLLEAIGLGFDSDRITWIAGLTGPAALASQQRSATARQRQISVMFDCIGYQGGLELTNN